MQALLDIAPVAAFFAAYYLSGHNIYTATATLMVAMLPLLIVDLVRTRRIPPLHALSAVLVFGFGSATLILHDQRFIQWKPTVLCWLVSAAFLVSFRVGAQTLAERTLGAALVSEGVTVPARSWRVLNWLWVVFYAALGALNLLVAYYAPERVWVNFKLFGLWIAIVGFTIAQLAWLLKRGTAAASPPSPAA